MIEGKWKIDRSYKNICIELLTENLASLRAKAGITQEEISNLVGISRQTYYAIETGQRTMSWNTYLSLLLFFDTNNSTRSMLRTLNIYPKELMSKMCGICDHGCRNHYCMCSPRRLANADIHLALVPELEDGKRQCSCPKDQRP